jgi:hypothetical protein
MTNPGGRGTKTKGARGPSAVPSPGLTGPGDVTGPTIKPTLDRVKLPPGARPSAQMLAQWDDFYRTTQRDKPGNLLVTISDLGTVGRTPAIEAALLGYLKYHRDQAEPWMYEMLAEVMDYNKARPEQVRLALTNAAQVAERSKDPNGLTSVAALMIQHGFFDKAAPLVDAAIKKMPYALRPLDLSIEIARRSEDPKRMVAALELMLSLGWPGVDQAVRDYAQKRLDDLADVLVDDKRNAEATALRDRWRDLSGRDVFIRLKWDPQANADLDLIVEESVVPGVVGARASRDQPITVYGGALVKDGRGKNAEEVYVCPRALKSGCTFTVRVDRAFADPRDPVATATLEIVTREGMDGEHKETRTITFDAKGQSRPITFRVDHGRRARTLPYIAAVPIVKDDKAKPKPKAPAAKPGGTTAPKPKATAPKSSAPTRTSIIP